MIAWALLALFAVQIGGRALGRPSLTGRLLLRLGMPRTFGTAALGLWLGWGLPAALALLLLGRTEAAWRMPPELEPAAAVVRGWGLFAAWEVLLGVALGSLLSAALAWWRARRGRRPFTIGRPPRLPRTWRELPAGAVVAVSAGVAEELYFRLALPLAAALAIGSAWVGVALSAAAFGLAHRYQGRAGMVATGLAGLFLSALHLGTGELWLAMACHAAIDVNALVIRPAAVLAAARR